MKNKLVADWVQDLQTRKNGKPVKTWRNLFLALERLCNTCKIQPMQLIANHDAPVKILKNFAELAKNGQIVYARTSQSGGVRSAKIENTIHSVVMAVRDFCGFHHITWRRGVGGIMSGKVVGHGQYADKRFSDEEFAKADDFIKATWGMDSDIYRVFWCGIETCARMSALINMQLDWTKHTNTKGKTTYFLTVFESKTEHIKGGKWVKYVTRPETQQSLELAKQKGYEKLWDNKNLSNSGAITQLTQQLKQIYRAVGKVDEYFYKKPFHSMRHIGAHYWLEKKDYNYSLVCILGGWHTEKELKDSYGEMPPEKVLELLEKEREN